MLQLDSGDHRPLYEQICDKLKELIISGVLSENEKIPSVREMASALAINPNTIQKAYKELENEGYIYSLKAKGNFVSSRKEVSYSPRAAELTEAVAQQIRELRFMGIEEKTLQALISQIYKEEQL